MRLHSLKNRLRQELPPESLMTQGGAGQSFGWRLWWLGFWTGLSLMSALLVRSHPGPWLEQDSQEKEPSRGLAEERK